MTEPEATLNGEKNDDKRSGVCAIKAEYLLEESVRKQLEQPKSPEVEEKDGGEEEAEAENGENDETSRQPPLKRFKCNRKKDKPRGQNKNRSVPFRSPREANFCFALANCTSEEADKKCEHKGCVFMHDRLEYLGQKPASLEFDCREFELTGYCKRGITCRLRSKHITEDGFNVVDREKLERWEEMERKRKKGWGNSISKETTLDLRKYRYNFAKAEHIVKKYNWRTDDKFDKSPKKNQNNNQSQAEEPTNGIEEKKDKLETVDTNNSESKVESLLSPEKDACKSEAKQETVDSNHSESKVGPILDTDEVKLREEEKKPFVWRDKLMLAPLTTVGNLPFRRICKEYGADVTCGEMALAPKLLKAAREEWALVKRHESEDVFGVQIAGNNPGVLTRCCQLLRETAEVDFIDLNLGCPIDLIYKQGAGCGMMNRLNMLESVVRSATELLDIPFTVKCRTGIYMDKPTAHKLMPKFRDWGVSMVNIHGRSREQRYTKLANWDYIEQCAQAAAPTPVFGTGDILSWDDYQRMRTKYPTVQGVSIARGALIKPWIFQEIKEQKLIDVPSGERFEMMKRFTKYGLEHWGSDTRGIETTRRFLLEWISFLYRYVPVGILVDPPQRMNNRPPYYKGRDDLETLMASPNCTDWIKLSEMLLGKVPDGFNFLPKHKANSWN